MSLCVPVIGTLYTAISDDDDVVSLRSARVACLKSIVHLETSANEQNKTKQVGQEASRLLPDV